MPGFASIEVPDVGLSQSPALVAVFRYQPNGSPVYQLLPNIRVLSIRYREGADPGVARFRYVFYPADPSVDPTGFEQAMSVDSDLAHVVQNDDRLVVLKFNTDGSTTPLFDGFAQVPELSLSPSHELVTFLAFGVAVREWDTPIGGALMRDADDPMTVTDVKTELPTYFNPDGEPNATPENADAEDKNGNTYATFLDPLVIRQPDLRRTWTLPMAARYLCFRQNPDETYVTNPDGDALDALLDSRTPLDGVTMDPSDPSTYQSDPIDVPDFLATDKAWPLALFQLLEPNGIGMAFRLEADDNGDPVTWLDIFRRQDGSSSSYKDLFLQPAGEPLDPSQSNLGAARLARDTDSVANVFEIETAPVQYEASFVLAPGFPIAAGDAADAAAIQTFNLNDPSFSKTNRDMYRLYVFDETGEGHWDFTTSALDHEAPPLDDLLAGDDPKKPDPWVKRRRVPKGELITTDANFKPLRARLAISTDFEGDAPGLWDGGGTWQDIAGGFSLLKDRLGIWINVPNPNNWNIGIPSEDGMPYPAGVVRGVEDQAAAGATNFYLRLTCVVDGDLGLKARADQRPSSSSSFAITRRIDGSDRYFKQVVAANSEFNPTANPVIVRDDTDAALAEATARRLAGEAGEVRGTATIPRFTSAYQIGDKICSIIGRNLSLQTNAGAPAGEGEVYPAVVAVTWNFDGGQHTILQLSDHKGEH